MEIAPHSTLLGLLCSMLGLTSMEVLCVACFLFSVWLEYLDIQVTFDTFLSSSLTLAICIPKVNMNYESPKFEKDLRQQNALIKYPHCHGKSLSSSLCGGP